MPAAIGLDGNADAHYRFATFDLDRSIESDGEIIAVYRRSRYSVYSSAISCISLGIDTYSGEGVARAS